MTTPPSVEPIFDVLVFAGPLKNNNVKLQNSALSREREPRGLILIYFYFTFTAVFLIQFLLSFDSDEIALGYCEIRSDSIVHRVTLW